MCCICTFISKRSDSVAFLSVACAVCTLKRWLRDNEANELNISSLLPICKSFENFSCRTVSHGCQRDNCRFSHVFHCLRFPFAKVYRNRIRAAVGGLVCAGGLCELAKVRMSLMACAMHGIVQFSIRFQLWTLNSDGCRCVSHSCQFTRFVLVFGFVFRWTAKKEMETTGITS